MDETAREFLFSRIDYERQTPRSRPADAFRLDTMRRLLAMLGDPQSALTIVHVAGTKGKGSTATLIAEMIHQSGMSAGLYTSPHLHRFEERFWINGDTIDEADLDSLIGEIRPHVEEIDRLAAADSPKASARRPTFFEIATAIAFLQFCRRQVDVAVIEVGLGGRLDSTNVCQPCVSVITNIGLDHTHLLGDRLELIASEKAGIIKPEIPVITGEQPGVALDVIRQVADERGAPLLRFGRDFGSTSRHDTANAPDDAFPQSPTFDFWLRQGEHEIELTDIRPRMLGQHQVSNACVALTAVHVFNESVSLRGRNPIDGEAMRRGIETTQAPARFENASGCPRLVLDIAHNVPAMKAFVDTVENTFPHNRRTLILAVSRDKDLEGMIRHLPTAFDRVITTRFIKNPRAMEPQSIADQILIAIDQGSPSRLDAHSVRAMDEPREALRAALSSRRDDEWVFVAGSTFLSAEISEIILAGDTEHALKL